MGGALPNNPKDIAAAVAQPTYFFTSKGAQAGYKAADPLGAEAASADAKKKLEDMQRASQQAANQAADALRAQGTKPKVSPSLNPTQRLDRLRIGLASTIKTAGGGTPPVLSQPPISGVGKSKLGA